MLFDLFGGFFFPRRAIGHWIRLCSIWFYILWKVIIYDLLVSDVNEAALVTYPMSSAEAADAALFQTLQQQQQSLNFEHLIFSTIVTIPLYLRFKTKKEKKKENIPICINYGWN